MIYGLMRSQDKKNTFCLINKLILIDFGYITFFRAIQATWVNSSIKTRLIWTRFGWKNVIWWMWMSCIDSHHFVSINYTCGCSCFATKSSIIRTFPMNAFASFTISYVTITAMYQTTVLSKCSKCGENWKSCNEFSIQFIFNNLENVVEILLLNEINAIQLVILL